MSRGFPSMTALLGLLAVAGYQNRDKLAELLRGSQSAPDNTGAPNSTGAANSTGSSGIGSLIGQLTGGLGSSGGVGGLLSGGLGELMDRFKQTGHSEIADSWVSNGPNKKISPGQLEQAVGPDVLDTLSRQTGLPRQEIVARLSREL